MGVIKSLFISLFILFLLSGCESDAEKQKLVTYFEKTIEWMESPQFEEYRGNLEKISEKQLEIAKSIGLSKDEVLNLSAKYTDDKDIDRLTNRMVDLLMKSSDK